MVISSEVKQRARQASLRRGKIVEGLAEYYEGDMTVGALAERLGIPLRALIDFMQRHALPYKSGDEDRKLGLKIVHQIFNEIGSSREAV